ncbi:MAG: flagellar basal body rod protein FlgG [Thermoleophilaceae bacterium]
MMRSMFAAISGLKSHQVMLDVTAADLANVNTVGYKGSRMSFRDSMSQLSRGGAAPGPTQGGSNSAQIGLGTQIGAIENLMTGGALQTTGNVFDVAIGGEGWFRVGNSVPPALPTTVEYSRAGNFTTNQAGYLTTQTGEYVIGRSAAGAGGTDQLLQIPTGASNVAVGQDGSVSYIPAAGGARVVAGYISLAKFQNQSGLERQGSNNWIAGPNSGPEQVNTPGGTYGSTSSGTLEMSNVDLAGEFTSMITAQRGFQANSRVISTADQMLQDLVQLIR